MNELQLKTTEMFGEVQTDIYENESHEMFMTIEQLGRCLGYASKNSIKSLISRNPYIKNEEFSKVVSICNPLDNSTVGQKTRVFNEDGIYEVTFLSNTDKALEFRRWVRKLLKSLRKGDLHLTNGDVTLSPEIFDMILSKHLGALDNRILALEIKKPVQPNFWLWKKHVANKSIDMLVESLHIDSRTAYDMVYDNMISMYGFDKSFAISQFCSKYDIENTQENPANIAVIDAVADVPEYQREFIDTVNRIISSDIVDLDSDNAVKNRMLSGDRVQQTIQPLIYKNKDNSPNGSKTYRIVYREMGKSNKNWKNMLTRYNCKTKKELLLKYDKYFSEFNKVVEKLLFESEVTAK